MINEMDALNIQIEDINKTEDRDAIRNTKNNKATGENTIEMLKENGEENIDILVKLFSSSTKYGKKTSSNFYM